MAVSTNTVQGLAELLSLTPGDMAYLLKAATVNGSASGYTDVAGSPMRGVLVTVHHAGDGKFTIELH